MDNSDIYIGKTKDGKKHGQGTFTWVDGDKSQGEFMDGEMHWRGIVIYNDGAIEKGIWNKGKKISD